MFLSHEKVLMLLGVTLKLSASWFNNQPHPLSATLPQDTTSKKPPSAAHTHTHTHTHTHEQHDTRCIHAMLLSSIWASFTKVTSVKSFRNRLAWSSCWGIPNDACESDGDDPPCVWVCVCVCVCVSGRVVPLCTPVCPRWLWCHSSPPLGVVLFSLVHLLESCPEPRWGGTACSLSQPAPHHFTHTHTHAHTCTHTCTHTGLDYLPPLGNAHISPFSGLQTAVEGYSVHLRYLYLYWSNPPEQLLT